MTVSSPDRFETVAYVHSYVGDEALHRPRD